MTAEQNADIFKDTEVHVLNDSEIAQLEQELKQAKESTMTVQEKNEQALQQMQTQAETEIQQGLGKITGLYWQGAFIIIFLMFVTTISKILIKKFIKKLKTTQK
ncbi:MULTISPECIES: hypothetical protein [Moraxella]|uniref:Uncharacterized protein n=2 Tax=Moraxella TaxID=475 RepID=A0A378PZ09_MORBO|nr:MULTISPECIES: hypothetical protein [Moraxella]OPH38130.1 hypothetical protein B5J93_07015 [Moraxella equi]STY93707.1 Uncharacterised protein [Moraxella bovis]STY93719.1 Uncharacterised protein [Moraxella bovis]STY93731.1 Uncharacterised protein [Moraxella bovis]STZ02476.1 Uncharacterised protein [Moraxella equi]